jgi:hypothetical protein
MIVLGTKIKTTTKRETRGLSRSLYRLEYLRMSRLSCDVEQNKKVEYEYNLPAAFSMDV